MSFGAWICSFVCELLCPRIDTLFDDPTYVLLNKFITWLRLALWFCSLPNYPNKSYSDSGSDPSRVLVRHFGEIAPTLGFHLDTLDPPVDQRGPGRAHFW